MYAVVIVRDEVKKYGIIQYRVRAIAAGVIIHTVVRWTESEAARAMANWVAKNVDLADNTATLH
jgi:hypothetical protein